MVSSISSQQKKFQSTLSMRRATENEQMNDTTVNISIHALHEESDLYIFNDLRNTSLISIHALHEESDADYRVTETGELISIHALHEESDAFPVPWQQNHVISIHALHEESDTCAEPTWNSTARFQSTLSMRRATKSCVWRPFCITISIHALHEESDAMRMIDQILTQLISIHALHEESDLDSSLRCQGVQHFNPRSP